MKISAHNDWRLLIANDNGTPELFGAIQRKDYSVVKTLKKHHRSDVLLIEVLGQRLVLKIPHEKNKRLWIRFLTLVRQGEAFKNISGMSRLLNLGFYTTQPVMAAEKRTAGMVTDSWLVYKYLDAESCLGAINTYPEVVNCLQSLHAHSYLHGDPQIRNFLHSDGKIFIIDSNPSRVGWLLGKFSKAYEWAYLRKSDPPIEQFFGKIRNMFWYRFAIRYDRFDRKMASFRRRLKKIIGITRPKD